MPPPKQHTWFGVIADQKRANTCFVMMPFTTTWANDVWGTIHGAFGHEGMNCIRADSMRGQIVLHDIVDGIARSTTLLADITGASANVYYELGIAHAWELDVLMIGQPKCQIPFDTKGVRHIIYEPSAIGLNKLTLALREFIRERTGPRMAPGSIAIIPPSPGLLEGGEFLGQWEGVWTGPKAGALPHTLVLYELFKDKVSLVYFSGNLPDWGVAAGYRQAFGQLQHGVVHLEWPTIEIKYALEGSELVGTRKSPPGVFHCRLTKVRGL